MGSPFSSQPRAFPAPSVAQVLLGSQTLAVPPRAVTCCLLTIPSRAFCSVSTPGCPG